MARAFTAAIFVLTCVARLCASEWQRTQWRGEDAWESVSASGWTAVVSVERARLIALSPPGSADNLLFADLKNEITWGGHRFWLGPQSSWAVIWPPPTDWETSAATKIETDGALLRLTHPRTDLRYPQLVRTYDWRGDALHCSVAWNDARFQGIHVVQIPNTASVRITRKISNALPLGYALLPIFRREKLLVDREVAPAVSRVEGKSVVLRGGVNVTEKIGVPPQDLVAEMGGYQLTLRRGKMCGMSETKPDLGLLTQVFIGNNDSTFIELEQLTPLGGNGPTLSEIVIEPQSLKLLKSPPHRKRVRR